MWMLVFDSTLSPATKDRDERDKDKAEVTTDGGPHWQLPETRERALKKRMGWRRITIRRRGPRPDVRLWRLAKITNLDISIILSGQ
ncbi:hypothetical protein KQX54_016512 [Cotesia glomerata]|uniref:Uncharacterized protein n=1 Tax=Cotesia glomerata TaxID=32391 RepID=A0AAV7HXQ8_COTGL|nr:hypothetical protein KQX54_016512 [Cotesia glomerata]